jgi:hypothetical protein
MIADLGDTFSGNVDTIEKALAQDIQTQLSTLQPQIGTWQLVWGPAVHELPGSVLPDNTMYVVRRTGTPGPQQLAVAIAGTNPFSFLDWLVEDFFVSTQVPWPGVAGAKISSGTFIGLSVLQTMRPGATLAGAGQTVGDFLAAQAAAGPVAITVTGHSLGGALAPTLGLWLHDTRTGWDPRGNASLSVLPFAGPTAGNLVFAQHSDAQIGPQVNRIHNSLDVVPHAWASADLQQLPALYQPYIQPDLALNLLVGLLQHISAGGGYTQIRANAPALQGTVDQSYILPILGSLVNYLVQAAFQHVDAYYKLLQVTEPGMNEILQRIKASAPLATAQIAGLQAKLVRFQLIPGV